MSAVAVQPAPLRAVGGRVPMPTESDLTLDVLGAPQFSIALHGIPAPQGSKKAVGRGKNGRVIMVESSDKVKPWREAVTAAALAALPAGWVAMDGPLVMDIILTLPRPQSAPKTLRTLPTTYPDLDKLARSTGDALSTDCAKHKRAVIADDARIVAYRRLAKVYEKDVLDPDALRQPGAVIRLWSYPAHLIGKVF